MLQFINHGLIILIKLKNKYDAENSKSRTKNPNKIKKTVFFEMKMNPNSGDEKNWKTCVHHAAENGHLDVLEYLEGFDDRVDFCATTRNGDSAIHLASRNG